MLVTYLLNTSVKYFIFSSTIKCKTDFHFLKFFYVLFFVSFKKLPLLAMTLKYLHVMNQHNFLPKGITRKGWFEEPADFFYNVTFDFRAISERENSRIIKAAPKFSKLPTKLESTSAILLLNNEKILKCKRNYEKNVLNCLTLAYVFYRVTITDKRKFNNSLFGE